MKEIQVRALRPLPGPAHQQPRPVLQALSDDELLRAVRQPRRNDPLKINTRTGEVADGNGRAYELLRRAADPKSSIGPETMVPVVEYTPDRSMFTDLD